MTNGSSISRRQYTNRKINFRSQRKLQEAHSHTNTHSLFHFTKIWMWIEVTHERRLFSDEQIIVTIKCKWKWKIQENKIGFHFRGKILNIRFYANGGGSVSRFYFIAAVQLRATTIAVALMPSLMMWTSLWNYLYLLGYLIHRVSRINSNAPAHTSYNRKCDAKRWMYTKTTDWWIWYAKSTYSLDMLRYAAPRLIDHTHTWKRVCGTPLTNCQNWYYVCWENWLKRSNGASSAIGRENGWLVWSLARINRNRLLRRAVKCSNLMTIICRAVRMCVRV